MTNQKSIRRPGAVFAIVLFVLLTSACGNKSASAEHNSQDVTFAQMMIAHHQEAIDMAKLAEARASNADVKKLALEIEAAQTPEISTLTQWLQSWSEPTTADAHSSMSHNMPGAMSASDMTSLANATGSSFDRSFLTMMAAHHKGAIEMAKTEQASGEYGPAKELAASIVSSQGAELVTMSGLLEQIPPG